MFTQTIEAVAVCKTPYQQKFGIPRQPGLVDAQGQIKLTGDYNHPDFVQGIEQYSHLWLLFSFHENLEQGFKAKVRPPRLGGNEKIGVFATRSTFRPNGIGQSVVRLHQVRLEANQVILDISGMDLVNNTPILDIKPYLPFSDSLTNAKAGMAQESPELCSVNFSKECSIAFESMTNGDEFKRLIEQVLSQDPRPAYKKNKHDDKDYFISLYNYNIGWKVVENQILVNSINAD
ncbi:tRNA (N6-threonylcarbamoyladenosine(37)-N6)-methyltransferase TrmO [Parashewanella curva]|uniref:tRNA (N6-threonylcarbamoyladenosine(37)-N6)-methyltransferase TrmO n=1 Tax=Parashewanella curva TaxID=2338552 RepID=A0A3L8PTJ7_9GAMM|nr:tRNA (N6-threonylcarbamoyladenosine(37)-N6)-methyltransferase TrmO [Parashewanella curva]RLV58721.1 tRNA (N6-threonylcarbamoyladenosine(37)-N6)-methyltransferase TrmO [Parashewanella curva]